MLSLGLPKAQYRDELDGHIMTQRPAKPEHFRFLLRSWYNTTRVDLRTQYAQYSNLRRHELKLCAISRSKPLQSQSQHRENEAIRIIYFRRARQTQRRENAWYTATPIIWNPLNHGCSGRIGRRREDHLYYLSYVQ